MSNHPAVTNQNFPRLSSFSSSALLVKKLRSLSGPAIVTSPGDLTATSLEHDAFGDNLEFVIHKDGQVWAHVTFCDEDHPFHTITLCKSLADLLPEFIDFVAEMAEESSINGDLPCPGGSAVGSLAGNVLKLDASITNLRKSTDRLMTALKLTGKDGAVAAG
ncbi:hypothetical protein [Granulicella tundricola]|nr:hypothetical protein [Granulicella tundricola]